MNNYIIDPAVFYWMNVLSIVQTVLAVIGAFALSGFLGLTVTYVYQRYTLSEPEKPDRESEYEIHHYQKALKDYEKSVNFINRLRKWMIATAVIGIVLTGVAIFVPSKQTSVEMLVARTATFDNVNWTVAQVKEIIDYIVSALKGAV